MNADELDSLTERVLGAVFEVTNTLGAGFLEESLPAGGTRAMGHCSLSGGLRRCAPASVFERPCAAAREAPEARPRRWRADGRPGHPPARRYRRSRGQIGRASCRERV